MPRLLHYQPSQTTQASVPAVSMPPPQIEGQGSRLASLALGAGSKILELVARDHARFEAGRVDEAILGVEREFEQWKTGYMQTNQGRDATLAQRDFTLKYEELAKRAVEDFGGGAGEMFRGDLEKKLAARGLMYMKEGGAYQRRETEVWEKSLWAGRMAEFQKTVADDPADLDRHNYLIAENLQKWREMNPGQDDTAIRMGMEETRDKLRTQAFIASQDYARARGIVYGGAGKLGDYIAHEESGAEGVMAVGHDANGGTSYGKFQLSSKQGSLEQWHSLLESRGGKAAEIARELRAAGPADTGGKKGAYVDAYTRLARENSELFEETQRESLVKNNYNVTLGKIPSSLRGLIENDPALAEMVFSASVQHGGAGAAKILNKVFAEGMDRERLVRAVYAERGNHFQSSTREVQAAVRARFTREAELILGMSGKAPVMAPQDRISFQHQIQAAEKRDMAEFRARLEQPLNDWLAASSDGIVSDCPVSGADIARAYGEDAPKMLEQVEAMRDFAITLNGLKTLPVSEHANLLEAARPKEGTAGYQQKNARYQNLLTAVQRMRKQQQEDCAGWLADNDESVKTAQTNLLQDFTPQNFQAYQTALASASGQRGLQDNTGIFPKQTARLLAGKLQASDAPSRVLSRFEQTFGSSFKQAMGEIMPEASAKMNIIANGMPGASVKMVMQAHVDKDFEKNARELLSIRGTNKSDFEEQVKLALEDFNASLMGGGNSDMALAMNETTRVLALKYMMTQGLEMDRAIERAASDCGLSRYRIARNSNTQIPYRIPDGIDPGPVKAGAQGYLDSADIAGFAVTGMKNVDEKAQKDMYRNLIRREGYWLTNTDETGLQLFLGAQPVLDSDNQPVNLTWEQLASHAGDGVKSEWWMENAALYQK